MRDSRVAAEVMAEDEAEQEPWEGLVVQELQQAAARRLNVSAADVKPCFARIGPVAQTNRNNTAFMYATELRRMGVAEGEAWREIGRWNETCKPPLSERELRSAFESAWESERVYGCRGALAAAWCIGREKCEWHKRNVAGRRKAREEDFWDFGWPAVLKSREVRLYPVVVRLEKRRGAGAGGLVIASTREYAEQSGVYRGQVMAGLEELEKWGLLVVMERGERRAKGLPGRACQVRRVLPIPEPPVALVNERRRALCR
jgi:hypothetical protein